MKKILLLFISSLFLLQTLQAQSIQISGTVTDDKDQPIPGANVIIKGKVTGTVTDADGKFALVTSVQPPFTLLISSVGYTRQEVEVQSGTTTITAKLPESTQVLDEIVFAASRVDENILKSPVSIEKMDIRDIRNTASMNFYEGLQNLKGVEMVTSGLTFNQINTRGFNSTGNSRFLQLVDFVDNQTPGLGFAVGNLFGSSDLDMESAELIPGAASALYGPVAFNGVLMMRTKDPFQYQGLSVQTKVGMNHFNETEATPHALGDFAIRYAKAFNNKFAFKINASYMAGLDWFATNYTDVDPGTPEAQRGPNNPARNGLNIYGDDATRTLTGIGPVSRTGYEEKDLTDYHVYSTKLNGALHYRINENATLIYQYNFGQGTANYTGSNRFSINNFTLQQHRLELKGANFFVRAYSTSEDSHDSYNAKGLGQLINQAWASDDVWYGRYQDAYNGTVSGITPASHAAARAYADQNRFVPGSKEFNDAKAQLIKTQGLSGAGILSQSALYHAEGQYDLSSKIKVFDLLVGGNFRLYNMFTNGTLFDDAGGHIYIKEGGAFVQASKKITERQLEAGLHHCVMTKTKTSMVT
ncbi:MAG: carboxypeptidase-like regulatory domain-containing protein [Bacteroidota bacterium]